MVDSILASDLLATEWTADQLVRRRAGVVGGLFEH